jgi:hypothetical protein
LLILSLFVHLNFHISFKATVAATVEALQRYFEMCSGCV